jgi:hypothetical protein
LDPADHVGHGESLAGTGHAQQGLVPEPRGEPPDQRLDRLRLVAPWLEVGNQFKKRDRASPPNQILYSLPKTHKKGEKGIYPLALLPR